MSGRQARRRPAQVAGPRRGRWVCCATVLLTCGCGGTPAPAPDLRTGYVVGVVTRSSGAPARAAIQAEPRPADCGFAPGGVTAPLGTGTDPSTGRYRQPVFAVPGVSEACLTIVAGDLVNTGVTATAAGVRLPMRVPPESVTVNLTRP